MTDRGLPPGQRWVDHPIVYDIGPVSPANLETFRLQLTGVVDRPVALSWAEWSALPRVEVVRDFHCVTTWSVRAVAWEGVLAREVLRLVRLPSDVQWVLARGRDGYTTSVPYAAFSAADSLLADRMNGEPLSREHGSPLRLVVPSLYAWKSAKYLEELQFHRGSVRGFWEERGYHDRGDPWLEERFREPRQG